jgi:hypothetical protein
MVEYPGDIVQAHRAEFILAVFSIEPRSPDSTQVLMQVEATSRFIEKRFRHKGDILTPLFPETLDEVLRKEYLICALYKRRGRQFDFNLSL